MSALPTYSTGTVAVTTGGAVTVTGGIWSGTNVVAGDMISVDGGAAVLLSDVSLAAGQIAGWTGGAVSGKTYVVYQTPSARFDNIKMAQDAQAIVAALNTEGFYIFVPSTATEPDPSLGDDGQYAFQASTGKWWAKSGGLWGVIGSPYGLQPAANLSDVADAATALTNLGGTTTGKALFTAATAAAARTVLGIGTAITNLIAADVNLSNTSNYFDGPSLTQGSSGTWFVIGKVTLRDTSAAAVFLVKLTDGTTTIDSAVVTSPATSQYTCCTVFGIVTSPAGNLRVSVKDLTSTNGVIRADASLEGSDSSITAIRLA